MGPISWRRKIQVDTYKPYKPCFCCGLYISFCEVQVSWSLWNILEASDLWPEKAMNMKMGAWDLRPWAFLSCNIGVVLVSSLHPQDKKGRPTEPNDALQMALQRSFAAGWRGWNMLKMVEFGWSHRGFEGNGDKSYCNITKNSFRFFVSTFQKFPNNQWRSAVAVQGILVL